MPLKPNSELGSSPRRSHRLIRVGLVVFAVLVLLVLPGYLASRPGFFERYPSLSDQYGPWSKSTHVEAGCEGCHVSPAVGSRAAYRVRMVGEFYRSIVFRAKAPAVFSAPTNEACLTCHSDLRSVSPAGDLQIPHRAHVTVLEMQCIECHSYLVHELNPQGKHTPTMEGCLTCHDGDRAKDACTACHTAKAAPATHSGADWLVVHGTKKDDPACVSCHQWKDDWCADCHSQRPASHGSDWRAVHGEAVKRNRSCEACHDGPFCIRCHGEVPPDNFDAGLKIVE